MTLASKDMNKSRQRISLNSKLQRASGEGKILFIPAGPRCRRPSLVCASDLLCGIMTNAVLINLSENIISRRDHELKPGGFARHYLSSCHTDNVITYASETRSTYR